jgi:hypothetical protein
MWREHNSWDETSFMFVAAKTRWAAGGNAIYQVTDKLNVGARVEREWINAAFEPAMPIPVVDARGWTFAVTATLTTP